MKIIVKNLQKKIPFNPKGIKKIALNVLSLEGIKKSGQICFCFVNDKRIKELNLRFLNRNFTTDVLSFDNSINKSEISADIVISTERAISNARVFKTTPIYELYLYIIHGILHLLGYDDKNARQRKMMQDRAICILATLKLITHNP